MGKINREDMMELTRRMTPARSHFTRIAGAYIDEEGYIDNTFNTSFRGLSATEKKSMLAAAKEVVFSETNTQLEQFRIPGLTPGSFWQFFAAMCQCDLKNDALLLSFYEAIAEQYPKGKEYAVYVIHGMYDVPIKTTDHQQTMESEEVYSYLIVSICPLIGEYEPGKPVCGLLYPAFTGRSADPAHVNIYSGSRSFFREFLRL
ncbi:MAG: DUF4317 family protein [Lachnospiraceae bacterium]|nr:DUF4317 family protein [Lachnospiraceae bacterium]